MEDYERCRICKRSLFGDSSMCEELNCCWDCAWKAKRYG